MKKKIRVVCSVLLCALLFPFAQGVFADDENLLGDAGFELRLTPEQGGWTLFDQSLFSTRAAHSGEQSLFNWGFSRAVPSPPFLVGTASGSYQEFPAAPGSRWRLTGFGTTPVALRGTPAFGIVQVSFFDAGGKDLGTVETAGGSTSLAKTSNQVNNKAPVGEWIFLDTGIATAPAGTATVQAFTLYVDYSGSNVSQGVYFDDLKLCALEVDDKDGSPCN